jgi:hypothetical protein
MAGRILRENGKKFKLPDTLIAWIPFSWLYTELFRGGVGWKKTASSRRRLTHGWVTGVTMPCAGSHAYWECAENK